MSVSGIGGPSNKQTSTIRDTPPAAKPAKPAATEKPAAKNQLARQPGGADGRSGFEVASADVKGAGKTVKPNPLEQASKVSGLINQVGGFAGAVHYALDKKFNLEGRVQTTAAGLEKALNDRAHIATGRRLVAQGFDKSIGQINNLLKNPVVKKHPEVAKRLQGQLQTVQNLKAQKLAPFDKALGRLNTAIQANAPKLASLSKHAQAMKLVGDALTLTGAVTNGVSAGINSPAQTRVGKVVDGLLSGIANQALGKAPGAGAVGALDAVTGQHISNALNGSIGTAVTVAEAVITRDTRGLEELVRKSQAGDYGALFQGASGAGQAIASLGDPAAQQRFIQDAASGKYGPIGQFGNALGDGLGRLLFGNND